MIKLRILFCLFLVLPIRGEFSSLSWQKIKLENEYKNKISSLIKSIDSDTKHIVTLDLTLKELDSPEFAKSSSPPSGNNNKDNGKNREPASSQERKKSSIVNFTDDPGEDKRVENIVFAKFGIMAPLIDNFKPEVEVEEKKREPASIPKIPGAAPPINEVEEKFKVLTSLDIFKHIENIQAEVIIDQNINENLISSYKDVFKDLKWMVGDKLLTPKLSFKPLSAPKVNNNGIIEQLKDFEMIIASILGALIFLITMLSFAKKLEAIFSKKGAASEAPATSNNQDNEKSKDVDGSLAANNDFNHLNLDGIERFLHFFMSFPEEGKLMIQGWLKSDSEDTSLKMNAIAQKLDNKDLSKILTCLSNEQRVSWKNYLGVRLDKDEMIKANFLISEDVLQAMVSPSSNIAPHVFDVMVSLSAENAARFVSDHVDLSPILYTELNSKIMSDIIKHVEPEIVERMVELSLTFEPSENTHKYEQFEKEVIQYHHDKVKLPGMKKIGDILNNVTSANELSIFKTIASVAGAPVVRESAISKFPTFLFKKLPEELLKNIIVSYQISKRVNLIYSLEEEGEFYLNIYAPMGSRAREMFDLEVEKIEMDKSLQKQIISHRDEIWSDFVSFVRKKIEQDSEYEDDIKSILDEWINNNSDSDQREAA